MKNLKSAIKQKQASMPLRWKLILAFVALALLPIASVGIYADIVARALINKAAQADLAIASNRTALQIDSYIMGQLDGIRTEAQQPLLVDYLEVPPDLRAGSIQELNARRTLVIFSRKDPIFINSYALLDERGVNLLDTEGRHIGHEESGYEYFTTAFSKGLPTVSSALFQEENNFYISAPVRNERGDIIGVLRAGYDAIVLQSMLLSILPEKGTGNFISIIDMHTYIRLADTGSPESLYKSLQDFSPAEITTLQSQQLMPPGAPEDLAMPSIEYVDGINHLAQSQFFEAYSDSIKEEALITGTTLKSVPWVVIEGRSQKVMSQPIEEQRRITILMAFIILVFAALVANWMSLVIARPVANLTSVARRIAGGDLDTVAPALSNDEVGALAQAFNYMTEKLRQTLAGLQDELRERKRTEVILQQNEAEMRATNEFLRSIMDSPKGVIIFSLDSQYRYTTYTQTHSETMKKIWDAEIEIGMNMLDAIRDPADRQKAQASFDRALQGEHFALQEEYGDADRYRTWWEDRYSPIYDEHNRITGLTVVVIDITERKKMESALRENEEKFRKVFHSSPVAICITALENALFLDANYAYWELSGLDPVTSIGRNPFELEIWNRTEERANFIQRLKQKHSIYDADYSFKNIHGAYVPTLAFYEMIQLGGEECILSMFYDMSEQKRTLEALQLAHKESETLRESLASIVTTFDLKEVVERILDQIKRVIPYDTASVWRMEGEWQTLVVSRDLPPDVSFADLKFPINTDNSSAPILLGDKPYVLSNNVQDELTDFGGPHSYINSWLAVPLKVHGKVTGLIALDGIQKNQFNQHHADLLVTFANQVAVALENASLFANLQAELRKQTALRSAAMSISSSLHLDEVLGEICKQICVVNDGTSAYIAVYERDYSAYKIVAEYMGTNANQNEMVSDLGVTYYKKDGTLLFDETTNLEYMMIRSDDNDLSPWSQQMISDYGGKSIIYIPLYVQGRLLGHTELWDSRSRREFTKDEISFCRTLSQQAAVAIANANLFEQLQNELKGRKSLIDELEAKNSELERFTYTVSHDLKSPLFTIRGFLGYLEQDALAGDRDRLQADMKRITDATEKMQRLLNELLELSRIGRLKNESTAVSFDELARDAVSLVQGRIMERGIAVHIDADMPAVYGDQPRLLEVVQNLVDNAAKFMGNQPEPRIEIGQHGEDDGKPVFYVRDNGVGVASEHYDRIFGLFNKLDVKSDGTGIGLALVKRIVEVHGGRIWVESEAGRGSTFYFSLPRA